MSVHPGMHPAEYRTWIAMKNRCTNPNVPSYHRYGGRGITICDRWVHSFQNFFADMGERPSAEHSIDRINNDGDYEPSNCRWATREEQQWNISTNHLVTINGETKPVAEWCASMGISHNAVRTRLWRGMDPKEALTKPFRVRAVHAAIHVPPTGWIQKAAHQLFENPNDQVNAEDTILKAYKGQL